MQAKNIKKTTEPAKAMLNICYGSYALEGICGDGKPGHKGVGRDYVYCDTDSIRDRDPSGQIHYMGVFETENTADRFITWGAKKYAYEDHNGLHLTVASVGKRSRGVD